ncbi:DUF5995 family protein [Aureisphaera galaxeae]|uniref:DUF5995 family protein n=1 Tax=Aureisphaera galaxeae TaxID=1538023 RepID=UPI002350C714|nr:DUF5995 family protein [Aureisphaera galaxeae]MDC8003662.1 DUF5995 family protein [Aureisphaera galaxeae]
MTATTIDEVLGFLDEIIETSKEEQSTLGYFAALYRKVTQQVKDKIGQHFFDDDARMELLDVTFANRYLAAYTGYKAGTEITESWQVAFEASENSKLIVLQHLLAGMNAHINLDLGIAAAEITDTQTIHSLQGDFNKINDILGALVGEVEKDLSEIWPFLLWILKVTKKVDNFLINFSMNIAREGAWLFANELVFRDAGTTLNEMIAKRDKKIAKLGQSIVKPGRIERFIFRIIRFGERGTVADKITALQN